jgi:drug/metabolite transporter (DMT)-like permease
MDVVLKLVGVLVLAAGVTAEVARTIPAAGLSLVLGASLAFYCWFLAMARRQPRPSQRRK